MAVDPAEYLCPVYVAYDHLCGTRSGQGIGHPPPVAMEHGKRVQVDIVVADPGAPTEGHRVQPQAAVGHLDTFGACGGSARVVDGGCGILVGYPQTGIGVDVLEQRFVSLGTDDESVLAIDARKIIGEFRVDQQQPRAGVGDDVVDLCGV